MLLNKGGEEVMVREHTTIFIAPLELNDNLGADLSLKE